MLLIISNNGCKWVFNILLRTFWKCGYLVAECLIVFTAFLTTTSQAPQDVINFETNENTREAFFNGSAYLRLLSTISVHRHSGLSFRTCDGGKLFTQHFGSDFITMEVNPEGLLFLAFIDQQRYEAKLNAKLLNNAWQNVNLVFRLGNLTLSSAGHTQVIANATYNSAILSLPESDVNSSLIIGEGFKGCILQGPGILFRRNVTLNSGAVFGPCPLESMGCGPLSAGGLSGLAVSTDFCHHEPCMMHGTCISRQDRYECHCYARYSGNNCQIDNGPPCDSNPCRNGGTCMEDSDGNYNCNCNPGYTGTLCESHAGVNQCDPNPCKNEATCLSLTENEYICECVPGWRGRNCEININECASNPCKHGGSCIDGINNYTCRCDRTGYEGVNCELNIDECMNNNPCLNYGECFDNYGGYICQCPMGFEGQNCELNLNECLSSPCVNGGTCVNDVGSYHCVCPPGFTSRHCELHGLCENAFCPANSICLQDNHGPQCVCKPGFMGIPPNCTINFCASNPCMNGGTCTSNKDGFNCTCPSEWKGSTCKSPASDWCSACMNGGTCIETIYGITCQCPRFWTGPQCKQQITCKDIPCKQISACHDYPGGYYCNCEPGWTGPDCSIDMDECASDPCRNGAVCIDQLNSYYCSCPPGYTGKNCQINIDECLSQPCENGGTCIDKVNGYICNCTRDFMGDHCEREYDACAINPCMNNGTCTLVVRSRRDYVCECPPGFIGKICDVDVDECIGAKCPEDRLCVDAIAGYECKCRDGYRGPNCSLIVDHCATKPCNNNGTCIDLGDTFECQCEEGYEGIHCDDDVDECKTKVNPEGSSLCNNGICVNRKGGYGCFCIPGFSGDHCDMDIDECACSPCKNNATCHDRINSFECTCSLGYTGKTCDVDVNECESNPCQNGASCVDHIAAYSCICSLGFAGSNCETNIDDCESSPCQNHGQCVDGINDYTCNCNDTGFEGSHCENNIDDCLLAQCENGATCIDDIKNYICQCYPGYRGANCEIDINECESTPCQYNGTCLERSNRELYKSDASTLPSIFTQSSFSYANASGYECICVQGVRGKNCETNINECESNPCFTGTCVDRIGGYKCECEKGWEGDHCNMNINECEIYHQPCAHGNCEDGIADYSCTCEPEFGGKNCSVPLIGCQGNACHNGGTCLPYLENETVHKFNCTCPNGFHGEICDNVTTMSLGGSSYVMVNTTRDEGYDIQFRFRTTLPNGLIAMGKGSTFYILELVNGKLNLHSSILNRWEGVFIGSGLNDSNWQKVFVAINTTHVVLSANEEQTIYPINLNEGNTSHTSFTTTYIGGTISYLRQLAHGPPSFVGCYEDVVINGQWVYTGLSSKTVAMEDVESGCPREEQCDPNPCENNGHCTDRWRDFSCKCERPYLGHTCQYNMTAATFGYGNITDGYVTVKVTDVARRAIRSIVDISMFIRTRQDTGDIFYLGSESSTQFDGKQEKPYIRASLEHGELLVKIQFNGSEAYAVGGVKLNEGNYHLIQVVRNVTLVQVKINGTEYFRKTIGATGQSNVTVLYLGGLPPQASRYSRQADSRQMEVQQSPQVNFKGIIQDVQISDGSKTMVVEFYPLTAKDIPEPIEFGSVIFDRTKVFQGVVSDPVCDSNPCFHNGTCHVTWNDFSCTCPRGYTGKMCQEMEFCQLQDCPNGSRCQNLDDGYECIANATFNGIDDSFTYTYRQSEEQNITESTIGSIEITYQSRTGGVLMHIASKTGDQNFVVSVYRDNITISWNLDIDNRGTLSLGKSLPDGNWTSIVIKLNNDSIESGYANSNDETIPHSDPNFSFSLWYELLSIGTVTLGGLGGDMYDRDSYAIVGTDNTYSSGVTIDGNSVDFTEHMSLTTAIPPESIVSGDAFRGCLGEVRIGPMLLHYFTYEEVYRNANFTPMEYLALEVTDNSSNHDNIGCRLCFNNDCKNGGHCLNEATSYKCECIPGYIEDDCSVDENDCENNDCKNGATCVDALAHYNCECVNGWQGKLCDEDIDECETVNPCRNNGTCINDPGSFRCNCSDEFTGDICESFKIITCENQPCRNGSTCIDKVNPKAGNNFTCNCLPGYEGPLCDIPYCIANKCQYGGTCVYIDQNPHCSCPLGYTGKYCETNIDDCAADRNGNVPCKNRGKCFDQVNSFTCDCLGTGYRGTDCSIDIDECTDPEYLVNCGNGQCENLQGNYQCICDNGYCGNNCGVIDPCLEEPCQNQGTCECLGDSGYTCHCTSDYRGHNCTEQERSLGSQALDIAVIVGPIVGCLLLIGAGSLIALFMMARKKRATRGTYSPSAQEFSNPRVEMDNVMKPPPEERLI